MTVPDNNLPFALYLFGAPTITISGATLPSLRTRKGYWLLALLALRAGRSVERTYLSAILWPDSEESKALYSLRRSLNDLRHAMGSEAWRLNAPNPRTLSLDLRNAFCDVNAFDAALLRGDSVSFEAATDLYRGFLLEGCDEEWVFPERTQREQAYLNALQQLTQRAIEREDYQKAAGLCRRILTVEPLREDIGRTLMQSLSAQGSTTEAIAYYRELRRTLRDVLKIAPAVETTEIYQALRRQHQPERGTAERVVAPVSETKAPVRIGVLPRARTPMIGQEQTLLQVQTALEAARLVTLTGSGGVGKTRLVMAVAEEVQPRFPGGVWFVELASSREEMQAMYAIAKTLQIEKESYVDIAKAIVDRLNSSSSPTLLILDSCEHLPEVAPLVDDLLQSCLWLTVIATSRQALNIQGEVRFRIPSLRFPNLLYKQKGPAEDIFRSLSTPSSVLDGGSDALEALRQYPAIHLFVERARAFQQDFSLTPQNAPHIAHICAHLGGIPLALELAAARVTTLSAAAVAARLEDHFTLLSKGRNTAPPRHQTMRACLDWSYRLLSVPEQLLLQRLALFVGGWTSEGAEAVCSDVPLSQRNGLIHGTPIEELLESLTDKSMIRRVGVMEGETTVFDIRYGMSETVRQYAANHLTDTTLARTNYVQYYAEFIQQADAQSRGSEQELWTQRTEQELDNCWNALALCTSHSALQEDGILLAGRLSRFWLLRGYWRQGSEALENLLRDFPAADSEHGKYADALARAYNGAGALAWAQGFSDKARVYYQHSLKAWRQIENVRGEASVLGNLAMLAMQQEDYEEAARLEDQSLAMRRRLNDSEGIATSLSNLGIIAWHGKDLIRAQQYHAESLHLRRQQHDQQGIATCLNNLGLVASDRDDFPTASILFSESASIFRAIGNRSGLAETLQSLAEVAYRQGGDNEAREQLEESILLFEELGERHGRVRALTLLGKVSRRKGDYVRAASAQIRLAELYRDMEDSSGVLSSLEAVGQILELQGQSASAHSLLLAVRSLRPLIEEESMGHAPSAALASTNGTIDQAVHLAASFCAGSESTGAG